MAAEQELKRIAEATERIAAHLLGEKPPVKPEDPAKVAKEPLPPAKTGKTRGAGASAPAGSQDVTQEKDLVTALREAVTAKKSEAARAILTKYKASKISEVKPEHFAAVVKELKALVAPPEAETVAGEDLLG